MYAIKSRIKEVRVGISASKKVGNAVVRNRARRVMREAWFELVSRIPKGFDFVLSARANTVSVKTKDVQRKIFAFLKKFGLSGL
jgi:ribonuclease P protein component